MPRVEGSKGSGGGGGDDGETLLRAAALSIQDGQRDGQGQGGADLPPTAARGDRAKETSSDQASLGTSSSSGSSSQGQGTREREGGAGAASKPSSNNSTGGSMAPPRQFPRRSGGEVGGFTQMDWMRTPDPYSAASRMKGGGAVRMEEVRKHRTVEDAWTVVRGKVYNITPYLRFHPGGQDMLMKGAGRDSTALFNKYHPWVNVDILLEKSFIGVLLPD